MKYLYNFAYPEKKPISSNEEREEIKREINDGEINEEKSLEKPQVEDLKEIEKESDIKNNAPNENIQSQSTNDSINH